MDDRELLRTVPIFADLSEPDLEKLTGLTLRKRYPKDGVVFFENESGDTLFMISQGRIKVTILGDDGREIILSVLGSGDFFGEMALLDDYPRSATVRTLEETTCVALSRWHFVAELKSNPDLAVEMLEVMSRRVRELDEKLTD